jgi:hypothetical protein
LCLMWHIRICGGAKVFHEGGHWIGHSADLLSKIGICYGSLKAPREARPIDTSTGSKAAVK